MDKEAAEVLKHIADKLDVPVQNLWAGMLAYAQFTYMQWLVTVIASASLILIAACVIVWALGKADSTNKTEYFGVAVIAFFCSILPAVTLAAVGVGGIGSALAARNAPEAWATHQILNKIGR